MSLRSLQHSKSNRIEISKGVPSPNEGNNGELRLGITSKGIFLYAKYGNRWYQLSDAAISAGGQFSAQGIAAQGGGTLATSIDRGDQSLKMGGNIVMNGNTVDGIQIAIRDAILTSTTTTANAALPKAGGTMEGAVDFDNYRTNNINRISFGASGAEGYLYGIKDEDDMASDVSTHGATQQSIKAYVDANQMHSIQDRFYFDVETASRTYFRDIDSTSYENKWDAYDSEDDTVVGNTISLTTTIASAGLIVPYDCKLKGVRWVGNNTTNYDNVVYVQTWTGASIPHDTGSTTAVTATLRDSITLTNIKRKYFHVNTALDVSMSAGQMIYPAFQYVSGTAVTYSGSVVFLLERA